MIVLFMYISKAVPPRGLALFLSINFMMVSLGTLMWTVASLSLQERLRLREPDCDNSFINDLVLWSFPRPTYITAVCKRLFSYPTD